MSGKYEDLPDDYDKIKAEFDEYDGDDFNGCCDECCDCDDESADEELTDEEKEEEMREIEMEAYAEGFCGSWSEDSDEEQNPYEEDEESAQYSENENSDEKLWDESFPDDIPF